MINSILKGLSIKSDFVSSICMELDYETVPAALHNRTKRKNKGFHCDTQQNSQSFARCRQVGTFASTSLFKNKGPTEPQVHHSGVDG